MKRSGCRPEHLHGNFFKKDYDLEMNEESENPLKEIARVKAVILSDKEQAVLEQITGGNWKKYGRVAMAALGGLHIWKLPEFKNQFRRLKLC
jgi:hypothetical protein